MGGDKLGGVLGEKEVANLRACVQVVDGAQRLCVPEAYAPVGSASTCGQYPSLMWIPTNSFDGCLMVGELGQRVCVSDVPDKQLIVVASGGHLTEVETPLEPTYFLLVAVQLRDIVIRASYVSHEYSPVA